MTKGVHKYTNRGFTLLRMHSMKTSITKKNRISMYCIPTGGISFQYILKKNTTEVALNRQNNTDGDEIR